jgi:hypothetical protein
MGFSKAQVQHAIEKCGIYTKFKPWICWEFTAWQLAWIVLILFLKYEMGTHIFISSCV